MRAIAEVGWCDSLKPADPTVPNGCIKVKDLGTWRLRVHQQSAVLSIANRRYDTDRSQILRCPERCVANPV